MIHERHDGTAALDEAAAGVYIGDVGELVVRDVQQMRQFLPIRRRLIQQDEELRVCQHGPCRVGLEQVLNVLTDPGAASLILSHAFPEGEQEIGAVLMLEQQVDLVDIDPGVALQPAVADDAVEDAVQHYQHTHRQELLAKIPDIIAEDAGVGIHIGGLGKGVQTALRKQLDGQSHIGGLLFRLAEQLRVEVLQGRGLPLIPAADIVPIDLRGASVNDGLFLGGQLPGADELLTKRQQELGFQHHRILAITVASLEAMA